jgi:hypothetical protein
MRIGAVVQYAYGWVDLDAPYAIPLQMVVGIARDPIMLACIRVSSVSQSKSYFESLGMKELPFSLARQKGSQFEQTQPKDSVYLSFSPDTLGLLLVPSPPKAAPLSIGNTLKCLSFVVDDAVPVESLPPLAQDFIKGGASRIYSPDGYPIELIKYSEFSKQATKFIKT